MHFVKRRKLILLTLCSHTKNDVLSAGKNRNHRQLILKIKNKKIDEINRGLVADTRDDHKLGTKSVQFYRKLK